LLACRLAEQHVDLPFTVNRMAHVRAKTTLTLIFHRFRRAYRKDG
jgi:hypothetical protein